LESSFFPLAHPWLGASDSKAATVVPNLILAIRLSGELGGRAGDRGASHWGNGLNLY
jgi:hypothetical protein